VDALAPTGESNAATKTTHVAVLHLKKWQSHFITLIWFAGLRMGDPFQWLWRVESTTVSDGLLLISFLRGPFLNPGYTP
jgi:hypothetical protein